MNGLLSCFLAAVITTLVPPVVRASVGTPPLEIAVYVRGTEEGELYAGEPIRVAIAVRPGAGHAGPVRLSGSPGKSWTERIRVRLHDANGRSLGEPARAAIAPLVTSMEAHRDRPAVAIFRWPASVTLGLQPGVHRISARWVTDDRTSATTPGETAFNLKPEPETLTPALRTRLQFAVAVDAHLAGERKRAGTLVDLVLKTDPSHVEARRLRAALDAPPRVAATATPPPAPPPPAPAAPSPPTSATPHTPAVTGPQPAVTGRVVWATSARASSEYRATDYGANRATGAPDVPRPADHRNAWTPKLPDAGPEWLELTYAAPVSAAGVRVVQSFNPGAIMAIEVFDDQGAASTVWTGPDLTRYAASQIGVLETTFERTARPIVRVRLTLDSKRVAGANSIDAVGLIPAP